MCLIKILLLYNIIQLFDEFTSSAKQSSTHMNLLLFAHSDSNIGSEVQRRIFIIAWLLSFSI